MVPRRAMEGARRAGRHGASLSPSLLSCFFHLGPVLFSRMEQYSTEDILHILRIDRRRLLKYRRAVAVCPAVGPGRTSRYTFHHLLLLRTAKTLCDAGIPVRRIRHALQLIQRHIGPGRGLQSITIAAVGGQIAVTDATGQWRPETGQLLLDYDRQAAFKVVDIGRGSRARLSVPPEARDWFEWGLELEQGSPDDARRAYEAALRLDSALIEAHINLGVWHHQAANLEEAERCYRRALHYDPRCVIAHFNLGLALEGKGDRQGAIRAHEELLRYEKSHREAHRCLGHLYEAEGRMREALRHYAEARRLSK
jgi:tetratricopeptide (TPR) repeat protein